MRIDKYLKVSRIIKRRTVANEACGDEHVLLNGKVVKPSAEVKEGDIIEVHYGTRTLKIRVTAITDSTKKSDAANMYEIME